jgi:hypothetical protein
VAGLLFFNDSEGSDSFMPWGEVLTRRRISSSCKPRRDIFEKFFKYFCFFKKGIASPLAFAGIKIQEPSGTLYGTRGLAAFFLRIAPVWLYEKAQFIM